MSKKISGAEYPLSKIFSSDFDFSIPPYQRPYSWTVDNAAELIDDLVSFSADQGAEDSYFLGSIVLIKEENNPKSEIIDGQQRLTTLTIILSVIASSLSGELRDTCEKYLREPGNPLEEIQAKPRLQLRDRDAGFFRKYIQEMDIPGLLALNAAQLDNDAQRNIQKNAQKIQEKVIGHFSDNPGGQLDQKRLTDFTKFLMLRTFLVVVSTPNQQSAFRIFAVMNNRGLDLMQSDILKAEIIGKITPDKQEEYTEKWEDMEQELGRENFNELFSHIRMIFARTKARKSILELFREEVIKKVPEPMNLIDTVLEPSQRSLATIQRANYQSNANAKDINNLLKWLNRIDFVDWIPAAIEFMNKNSSDVTIFDFLRKLERLTAVLLLTGADINERIERYAGILHEIQQGGNGAVPQGLDLTANEATGLISILQGDVYLLSPVRRRYLLLRLDSFIADGAASYDPALLTVEHVLPQTVNTGTGWEKTWPDENKRQQWVHKLANLVLLTRKRNSAAQNYDFEVKKEKYFSGTRGVSSYAVTSQVLAATIWDENALENRQQSLIKAITDTWDI